MKVKLLSMLLWGGGDYFFHNGRGVEILEKTHSPSNKDLWLFHLQGLKKQNYNRKVRKIILFAIESVDQAHNPSPKLQWRGDKELGACGGRL